MQGQAEGSSILLSVCRTLKFILQVLAPYVFNPDEILQGNSAPGGARCPLSSGVPLAAGLWLGLDLQCCV